MGLSVQQYIKDHSYTPIKEKGGDGDQKYYGSDDGSYSIVESNDGSFGVMYKKDNSYYQENYRGALKTVKDYTNYENSPYYPSMAMAEFTNDPHCKNVRYSLDSDKNGINEAEATRLDGVNTQIYRNNQTGEIESFFASDVEFNNASVSYHKNPDGTKTVVFNNEQMGSDLKAWRREYLLDAANDIISIAEKKYEYNFLRQPVDGYVQEWNLLEENFYESPDMEMFTESSCYDDLLDWVEDENAYFESQNLEPTKKSWLEKVSDFLGF